MSPDGLGVSVFIFGEGQDMGCGCALSKACRSVIAVCIPLVLRVMAVISGCV